MLIFTAVLLSSIGLRGCADWSHQQKNTAVGVVVGGVVGHLLSAGVLCTGAGAAVAGVIGDEVSKTRQYLAQQFKAH